MARILVVEDDARVAALLAEVLAADGHAVDTATDGLQALERLEAQAYDVLVTDVGMPRLDGPGLVRELARRRPELARRIVFVTGGVRAPETRRFLEAAGAPCLAKPFDPVRLCGAVRAVLER